MPDKKTLKEKIRAFPDKPGIYQMFDEEGHEIYIGKAKSLKKRIANYFQSGKSMDSKTMKLMEEARNVEYIETGSEVEALLLESRLIKLLKPKYNIDLKWGERYPFLVVSKTDDFPRVLITRDLEFLQKHQEEFLYQARFTAVSELRAGLDLLQKIFKFRTCGLKIHNADTKRKYSRPCLLFHIKRCTGPCADRIKLREYKKDIKRFIQFLEGNKDKVITKLEKDMLRAAKSKRYEDAARLRDERDLLKTVSEDGRLLEEDVIGIPIIDPEDSLEELMKELELDRLPLRIEGVDISHTAGKESVGSVVSFLNGKPFKGGYRRFKIKTMKGVNDTGMIAEVVQRRISRLQREGESLPDILLIDGGAGQVGAAVEVLAKLNATKDVYAVGLAKKEEILFPAHLGKTINLDETSSALKLLCYVRDESHRFARLYHTHLRSKSFLEKD